MESKDNLISILTGSSDARFIKSQAQPQLDKYDREVINDVHNLEGNYKMVSAAYNSAQGYKRDIEVHEKEREQAYDALGNLLNKETNFEKVLWDETSSMYKEIAKSQNAKSLRIKQKNVDSDPEMRFSSMMRYLDKYPEYQSKSSFKKVLDKIEEKEREIRYSKHKYHDAVTKYNTVLSDFMILFGVAENKIDAYHELLKTTNEKLQKLRYNKGLFAKFASERKKAELNIELTQHRLPQFEKRLKGIKDELSQYKSKKFVELDY